MSDIADFLRARYAERRAIADGATPGEWRVDPDGHSVVAGGKGVVKVGPDDDHGTCNINHIYVQAPQAVLADLDAKLAIVDEIDYDLPAPGRLTDHELHARCAHPAWEYRTTTGPRKQWDGVDDPPCDDYGDPEPGWERNVDAGLPGEGWERFDYTEESYWRRPRPGGPRTSRAPRVLRLLAQPFAGHPDHKGEEWAP